MKKFLIIAHAFPPFGGGGVQRIVKFATYLKENGWEATVVCPDIRKDSWLDFERLKEVENIDTIRVGYKNLRNDATWKKVIRKFYPIDAFFGWAIQVMKVLKKKDFSDYDVVFTSSPPHSIHLVGWFLSRRFNLKWVTDFRDHFTLNPEYKASGVKKIIDKKFEKIIFKKASAIILNTDTNKEDVTLKFKGVAQDKIHVIYNGFDYADLRETGIPLDWSKDHFKHYLYLGGLRGDRIDGAFYETLAEAINRQPSLRNELRIHIIGNHSRKGDQIYSLGIADLFELSDPVAFNRVADYLKIADGCLTWQRSEPRYRGTISGKFFDYLGMQRPVFSLGQDDGEIARILKKYHIGISADPGDKKKASLKFIEFHEGVKKNSFNYSDIDSELLNKFNRVEQSNQLVEIFKSISDPISK